MVDEFRNNRRSKAIVANRRVLHFWTSVLQKGNTRWLVPLEIFRPQRYDNHRNHSRLACRFPPLGISGRGASRGRAFGLGGDGPHRPRPNAASGAAARRALQTTNGRRHIGIYEGQMAPHWGTSLAVIAWSTALKSSKPPESAAAKALSCCRRARPVSS